MSATHSNKNGTGYSLGSCRVREDFLPVYQGDRTKTRWYWTVLFPGDTLCLLLLNWGDPKEWVIRVFDHDDTYYAKDFSSLEEATETYDLIVERGNVSHDHIVSLGFKPE